MLIGSGGLGAIYQSGTLCWRLKVAIARPGIGSPKDHRSESAIAHGERLVPNRRWRLVPQDLDRLWRPRSHIT